LVNEIDEVDGLGKATTVEQMDERLGQPGYHPEEDLFLAELDGPLVGYADMVRELEIGRVILDGAVHPAHRGRGMGSRLLEIAIEHSRKLRAEVVQIPIAQGIQAGEHFVRKRGFRLVRRHWQMSFTEYRGWALHIPQGFELRHFVPGDEESLCALQNFAFAGSWGFRPNTVEEIHYLANTSWCQPEGILLISEGQRKVGYCWTMDDPVEKQKGYIRMMGVDPGYRGRGLGRVILVAGIEYLRKRGMTEIELLVDSRNHSAKRLYQSAGFKRKGTTLWYQRRLSSG
jgi:mycothiol synthase